MPLFQALVALLANVFGLCDVGIVMHSKTYVHVEKPMLTEVSPADRLLNLSNLGIYKPYTTIFN